MNHLHLNKGNRRYFLLRAKLYGIIKFGGMSEDVKVIATENKVAVSRLITK